ncbi:single-stranded DNA-binding protein [Clostridium hydrogeniformans]|uniref:single-stranded DNA-binding protein n=1 Tax=Clostridium hydrogeniformans TaxID=349933 RepID=UPI0004887F06|nr:single-stranded DNA-binding protein [Clostridium hydrogeniformans]
MNKILLVGRLVNDPELKIISDEKVMARFILAVERNYKEANGDRKADFIPVAVWGKRAHVIKEYLSKGNLLTISGRLRTSTYMDEAGIKKYKYEVIAEDFKLSDFTPKKEA